MGLDVSLRTKGYTEKDKAYDKAYDAVRESGEWVKMTIEQKAEWRKANPYPWEGEEEVDATSRKHGEHLFTRRYLRSSYNSGGFNRAVPEMTGTDHDLYWIFEPVLGEVEQYSVPLGPEHVDALLECRTRALQVAEAIRASDPIRVTNATAMVGASEHLWQSLPTEDEVIAWYREEHLRHLKRLEEHPDQDEWFGDGGYSNAKGAVLGFQKGIEVLALTVGRDSIGQPAAMAVFRLGPEVKEDYAISAEITAEFCDEAIELIQRDGGASITWSG